MKWATLCWVSLVVLIAVCGLANTALAVVVMATAGPWWLSAVCWFVGLWELWLALEIKAGGV